MADSMLCAKCLSQYHEILSKARFFETGIYMRNWVEHCSGISELFGINDHHDKTLCRVRKNHVARFKVKAILGM